MSEKVDAVTDYLEKNWGAVPKAVATQEGSGISYTADPVIVDATDGKPTPKYSLENLNKVLNEDDAKENEMQISKTNVKIPKGAFDTSKLLTAPTVTMMKATKLYEPVRGTSSGSRYFMFAISPALRVAVRWKTTPSAEGLALRVEGSGLNNPYTVKMLETIGLDKKSDTHMSAHLTVANEIEARKALGALLFALNEPWSTPTPDPSVVCV